MKRIRVYLLVITFIGYSNVIAEEDPREFTTMEGVYLGAITIAPVYLIAGWERKVYRNLMGAASVLSFASSFSKNKWYKSNRCFAAVTATVAAVSSYYVNHPEKNNHEAGFVGATLLFGGMIGSQFISYCDVFQNKNKSFRFGIESDLEAGAMTPVFSFGFKFG